MDVVTHGLASYALTRAAFPRVSWVTTAGVIVAGTVADLDGLSARFGPAAFLQWHRTYTHSILAGVVIATVVSLALIVLQQRRQTKDAVTVIFCAALCTSLLHVAMDFCQDDRMQLLWPFRGQRYSADLMASFDLWILLILLAGVFLPKLFGLVTEEIGAKSKGPRGRIGAILALAAVAVYIGGRFILHGNAVAIMDSRTYKGESPRRIAALAEADSPLHWRGIVETERALHGLEVNLGTRSSFDPDKGVVSYKPEPSPALEAAQKTEAARRFLQAARFPKASVEKTLTGYRVEIREFFAQSDAHIAKHAMVVVEINANGGVTNQELAWDTTVKHN